MTRCRACFSHALIYPQNEDVFDMDDAGRIMVHFALEVKCTHTDILELEGGTFAPTNLEIIMPIGESCTYVFCSERERLCPNGSEGRHAEQGESMRAGVLLLEWKAMN